MNRAGKILDEMTLKVANSVKTISDAKAICLEYFLSDKEQN